MDKYSNCLQFHAKNCAFSFTFQSEPFESVVLADARLISYETVFIKTGEDLININDLDCAFKLIKDNGMPRGIMQSKLEQSVIEISMFLNEKEYNYISSLMLNNGSFWLSLYAKNMDNIDYFFTSPSTQDQEEILDLRVYHAFETIVHGEYIYKRLRVWDIEKHPVINIDTSEISIKVARSPSMGYMSLIKDKLLLSYIEQSKFYHNNEIEENTQYYFILEKLTSNLISKEASSSIEEKYIILAELLEKLKSMLNPKKDQFTWGDDALDDEYLSNDFKNAVKKLNSEIIWTHGMGFTLINIASVYGFNFIFNVKDLLKLAAEYLSYDFMDIPELNYIFLDALLFVRIYSVQAAVFGYRLTYLPFEKYKFFKGDTYYPTLQWRSIYENLTEHLCCPSHFRRLLLANFASEELPTPMLALLERFEKTKLDPEWAKYDINNVKYIKDFDFEKEKISSRNLMKKR